MCNSDEEREHISSLELALLKVRSIDVKDDGTNYPLKNYVSSQYMIMRDIEGNNSRINNKSIPVRRVVITPSTIEFKVMTRNMPNRVIRKFKDHIEDFMRVSFQSEGHKADRYNRENNHPLLDHISSIMLHGF